MRGAVGVGTPTNGVGLFAEGSSEMDAFMSLRGNAGPSRGLGPGTRNDSDGGVGPPLVERTFLQLVLGVSGIRTVVFSGATGAIRDTTGSVGVGGDIPRDLPDNGLLGVFKEIAGVELKPRSAKVLWTGTTKGVVVPSIGTAGMSEATAFVSSPGDRQFLFG